jgi:hypothetical protein
MLFLVYFSSEGFRATEMYVYGTMRENIRFISLKNVRTFSLAIFAIFLLSLAMFVGAIKNNMTLVVASTGIISILSTRLKGEVNNELASQIGKMNKDWLLTILLNVSFYLFPLACGYIIFSFGRNQIF